jgi:hypothetical protein
LFVGVFLFQVAMAATIANATVGMMEPLIPLYMDRTLLSSSTSYATNATTGSTTGINGKDLFCFGIVS